MRKTWRGKCPAKLCIARLIGISVDSLDSHEVESTGLGISDLDESAVADCITDVIELDHAGNALILDTGQSFQNSSGLNGASSLQSFQSGEVCIVTHSGNSSDIIVAAVVSHSIGVGVDPFLDAVIELSVTAFLIEGSDLNIDVLAHCGLSDLVVVPGIGAQQTAFEALCSSSLDDQLCIVGGNRSHDNAGFGSMLSGTALKDLEKISGVKVLVSLIERDHEAIIPKGNITFKEGDTLSLTGSDADLRKFFSACNAYKNKVKSTLIVGGGTTSVYLARMLTKIGISVTVIEKDRSRCEALCDLIPDCRIVCGDATMSEVLIEEGVRTTDSFVALTDDDGENIITSIYAHKCGAKRIVTLVAHEHFTEVAESSELDSVVTPKSTVVDQIISYVEGTSNSQGYSFDLLYRLADGKAEAIELRIEEQEGLTGIPLKSLKLNKDILIVGIVRGGKTILPDGDSVLLPGDHIIVSATAGAVRSAEDLLL